MVPSISSLKVVVFCISLLHLLSFLSIRSFLSMDTDGRVIRIDTVSKILSPGMRLGWVTGPEDFIAKYVLLQSQTANFPSSFSQSVMLGLVKHWGEEGLHSHLQNVSYCWTMIKLHLCR